MLRFNFQASFKHMRLRAHAQKTQKFILHMYLITPQYKNTNKVTYNIICQFVNSSLDLYVPQYCVNFEKLRCSCEFLSMENYLLNS